MSVILGQRVSDDQKDKPVLYDKPVPTKSATIWNHHVLHLVWNFLDIYKSIKTALNEATNG